MAQGDDSSNDNRGLASADEETRRRVASEGGKAFHEKRGASGSDRNTRGSRDSD